MSFITPSKYLPDDNHVHISSAFDAELRQLISERTGIVVQEHQADNLYKTVATAMQRYGHAETESFMDSLRPAEKNSPELEFLIASITVGESYFFRDASQISFLREQYLPGLIASRAKNGKYLRIWSAGCSDGQELYTVAFLLRDLIPDLENWRLHLLGTDINTETLATCQRGHYRQWSFRNTPERIRERYFHAHSDSYELHEDVQRMAEFSYLNLAEDTFPSVLTDTNDIDLILCRNVFIYFDQATVDKVLHKFNQCLAPGGILMLGASDLVNNNVPGMKLIKDKDAFYYRRQMTDDLDTDSPKLKPVASCIKPPVFLKPTTAKESDTVPLDNSVSHSAELLQQLNNYLSLEQWQAVDKTVDLCLKSMDVSAELLMHKATAAANLGRLEQSSQLCEQVLELNPLDKHAHFLSAIVLLELKQVVEAEAALRKVLFLDSQFLEAHYQLGLLQLRCARKTQGIKSLKNALQIAQQGNPKNCQHGTSNTSFERIAEMLQKEIKSHEARTEAKFK